tara:strand:- start:633 stop:1154 length:522 start_codon:yes stop_codon:yes gene_type:complete
MPPKSNQLAIYQEHKAIENKLKSLTASQIRSVAESVKKIANVKITSTKKQLIKQFMELHLGDYGGKKLFSLDASGMIQLPKERGESLRDVRKITNKQSRENKTAIEAKKTKLQGVMDEKKRRERLAEIERQEQEMQSIEEELKKIRAELPSATGKRLLELHEKLEDILQGASF